MQADSLPSEPPGKSKNTGVGNLSLLQGNFPTQESNRGTLHCRQILYQLSYLGSPQKRLCPQNKLARISDANNGCRGLSDHTHRVSICNWTLYLGLLHTKSLPIPPLPASALSTYAHPQKEPRLPWGTVPTGGWCRELSIDHHTFLSPLLQSKMHNSSLPPLASVSSHYRQGGLNLNV